MTKPKDLPPRSPSSTGPSASPTRSKELFNLRFQLATGRLDNVSRIAVVRKDIARLMTIEGEDAAAEQPAEPTRRSRG